MSDYDVSILTPSIRTEKLVPLFESLKKSCPRHSFEWIIISPYDLPAELQGAPEIVYIQDWGSPVRCAQRGLIAASAPLTLSVIADDSTMVENAVSDMIDEFLKEESAFTVLTSKYSEGGGSFQNDDYYKLNGADCTYNRQFADNWFILNACLALTTLLRAFGGFDCNFESNTIASSDLAVRLQASGVTVKVSQFPVAHCSHLPGLSGDHAPMHWATLTDIERFKAKYANDLKSINPVVDINDWQNAPAIWSLRFN